MTYLNAEELKKIDQMDFNNEIFQLLENFGNTDPNYYEINLAKKIMDEFPTLLAFVIKLCGLR